MPEILPGNLTERDMEILNILWESTESMTASQLIEADPTLTINMVQAVLRKLLKKNLIQVDKIVYSRTALCRSYSPTYLPVNLPYCISARNIRNCGNTYPSVH